MKNKTPFKTLITTCGVVTGLSAPVLAATAPAPIPHSTAIEEVLVTAQKRIENIQEVPKSVDVKSQDDLVKAGVTQLKDLASVVPQITTTAAGTTVGSAPAIRGVKTITGSIGVQSKTGVLVDEVAQPTWSTLSNSLVDIDRIEVFAGPQTTLSGRNAAAGLLSITTRTPQFTPEVDVGFTRTTDGQRRLTAFATAPLADQWAFSLSGYTDHQDGFTYSPLEQKHIGDSDFKGGRGKLLWQPTDALSATLSAYYVESFSQISAAIGSATGGLYYVDPAAAPIISAVIPLWNGKEFTNETYSPEHGTMLTRDRGVSLHLDYDIDRLGTLTSLTNYQKSGQPQDVVITGLKGMLQQFFPNTDVNVHQYSDKQTKYFSQELRLVSEDMDPWTWLAGALYSDSKLTSPVYRPFFLFGVVDNDQESHIKSAALFGRATYAFSDQDSLTLGLRYQRDKSAYSEVDRTIAAPANNSFSGDSAYGFWGGELSFKHQFTNDVNAYVTLARAETGEAYDLENATALQSAKGLDPLPSEKVKSIEVGVKSHLFDSRMTLNVDAFWTKYEHYQMQVLQVNGLVPTIRTFSIGEVETRGVELSSSLQATEALRLDFNAALLDAIITSYPGAPCYASYQTAAQGCVNATQDLSGARMPEAPRWKYTANADYTFFLSSLPFDANVGAFYRYQGSSRVDTFGDPYTRQPSYGILNLYAGIHARDDLYNIKLFVNNVFDKHFYTNLRKDEQFVQVTGGRPVISESYDRNAFLYGGISIDFKFK